MNSFVSMITHAASCRDQYEFHNILSIASAKKADILTLFRVARDSLEETNSSKNFLNRITQKIALFREAEEELYHTLSIVELFRLCIYAEIELEKAPTRRDAIHVKKDARNRLPFSLELDYKRKCFSVLLQRKGESFPPGCFGKITSVIEVSSDTVEKCIRKINRTSQQITDSELRYEKKYGTLRTVVQYEKDGIPRTAFTMDDQGVDLLTYLENNSPKIEAIPKFLKMLALHLAQMHREHVVHRDIKPENCTVGKRNGVTIVRLIDFGKSCQVPTDNTKIPDYEVGTIDYCAPEILLDLANDKKVLLYTGAEYKAQDMYSLGRVALLLMHEYVDDDTAHWITELMEIATKLDTDDSKALLKDYYDTQIQEIINHLAWLEERPYLQLEKLVFRLLHPNAHLRPTVEEFITDIDKLIL